MMPARRRIWSQRSSELGFAEFYFLSYDGNYMTPSGKTGYLGLQSNLDELLADQKDVVLNAALPGQEPTLVFICPETKGVYRGFVLRCHCHQPLQRRCDEGRGRFGVRRSGQHPLPSTRTGRS